MISPLPTIFRCAGLDGGLQAREKTGWEIFLTFSPHVVNRSSSGMHITQQSLFPSIPTLVIISTAAIISRRDQLGKKKQNLATDKRIYF